jgi:hypothetical protein
MITTWSHNGPKQQTAIVRTRHGGCTMSVTHTRVGDLYDFSAYRAHTNGVVHGMVRGERQAKAKALNGCRRLLRG